MGLRGTSFEQAISIYNAEYDAICQESHLYDGVEDLLDALKSQGMSLAIATMKPKVQAAKIVKAHNIENYFDCISAPEQAEKRKTELIQAVLETWNVTHERLATVSAVGDRQTDVEAAYECGIRAVFVAWGYGSLDRESVPVANNLNELRTWLLPTKRRATRAARNA